MYVAAPTATAVSSDTLSSLGYESPRRDSPPLGHPQASPPRGGHMQRGPMRKGHSPRNDAGDVTVLTPWYPDGLPKSDIVLGEEIRDFAGFMSLTPAETAVRADMVRTISRWLRECWPAASVAPYGSFAYGTSLPTSEIDVMADDCGDLSAIASLGTPADAGLRVVRVVRSQSGSNDAAFIQVAAGEITANVSMVAKRSQAQEAARLCRFWLQEFPAAARVAALVRHVLAQVRAGDIRTGGLSSYCVLLMVVRTCRCVADPTDDGAVLRAFLQEFSDFQFDTYAVSPLTADRQLKPAEHARDQLSVLDPLQPGNNLAHGCTNLRMICSQLRYYRMVLDRWSDAQQRRGYRGRTPLSGLVSHQPLWGRTDYRRSLPKVEEAAPLPAAELQAAGGVALPKAAELPAAAVALPARLPEIAEELPKADAEAEEDLPPPLSTPVTTPALTPQAAGQGFETPELRPLPPPVHTSRA